MTRLSTLNAAAAAQPHVPYAMFVDFDFPSGHIRLSSWDQDFQIGGNNYQALGKFCNFGDYPETVDLTASALTFTLSGADSSLMQTALTEKIHNRDAVFYVGYLDGNNQLVDSPQLLWEGFMDTMPLHSEEGVSSISVTCETRLLLFGKTAGWNYSDVHQKQFFSADSIFNLVASLANKVANWGAPSPASNSAGTPPARQSAQPAR